MEREELPNGYVRLTSPNGVKDTRTGNVHSEVVDKIKYEHFYEAA